VIRVALAFVALTGCDDLFDLEGIGMSREDGSVTSGDAPPLDARQIKNHDEDDDSLDDGFDNCPGVPNLDQTDVDSDGVGDACDPRPAMLGDRIVLFESFAAMPDLARWMPTEGSWVPGTDVLAQTDTSSIEAELWLDPSTPPLNHPTIEAVVDNFTGVLAGVTLRVEPLDSILCALNQAPAQLLLRDTRGGAADMFATFGAGSFGPYRIIATSKLPSADTTACIGIDANTRTETLPLAGASAAVTSARVGLYTFQGSADFRSVTVYDRL